MTSLRTHRARKPGFFLLRLVGRLRSADPSVCPSRFGFALPGSTGVSRDCPSDFRVLCLIYRSCVNIVLPKNANSDEAKSTILGRSSLRTYGRTDARTLFD